MDTIQYQFSQDIPVTHTVDVAVVGGGPGGLGAAVMAARAGATTLLIERYGALGGMASYGEVHPFMPNHANDVCLDKPVHLEWVQRMKHYLPDTHPAKAMDSEARSHPDRCISKDIAMLAAEDLCIDAGVTILYHHALFDTTVVDGRITTLVLASKSGLTAVKARMVVDCSGDADVAARAGCTCEEGGPSGYSQPMTLCFKLSHVDRTQMPASGEINRLYDEAKARGEVECPRENVLHFAWFDSDVVHFNTTRVVHKHATDGLQLSDAEIEARRQLREILAFLRAHVPGFEQAEIHSVAHHIGVRESRRVRGMAYVTRDDFRARRKYDDAIARVNYPIDVHNPDGSGTEHERIPAGEWYEIPFGSVVARDVRNLLIGGRPISVDHAVHSSMRVMPPACTVGQAAGMGAAMAVARGCDPAQLDGCAVRAALKAQGANL
jgi:hypothetical protein